MRRKLLTRPTSMTVTEKESEKQAMWLRRRKTQFIVYDAFGKLAAEYTINPQANQIASTKYLTTDTLGSPRVITNQSGTVESRRDFLPFGDDLAAGTGGRSNVQGYGSSADTTRQKFTCYERDIESDLDFAQARMYNFRHGRFTSTDPVLIIQERLYDPQQINLYGYCRNNPLAFIDPSGEIIDYANKDSRKAFEEYEKFLNKDKKKYASELATLNQLKNSDVTYMIEVGGKQSSETAEGNTVPDAEGKSILVRIRNIGGAQGEKFDRNGRFAHELEHARQFDSGELAFARSQDGKWNPLSYDIYDEVNAFNAQITVSPPIKDTPLLQSLRDERINDGDRARLLINRAYPGLENRQERANVDRAWGAKPGELVRPAANRPFFGRVYDPPRGRKQ